MRHGQLSGRRSVSHKPEFFRRYFFGYQLGRLECYDTVLRRHLRTDQEILSLASGRCANEFFLMEDGYRITCSDLRAREAYEPTRTLFPHFRYESLDILARPFGFVLRHRAYDGFTLELRRSRALNALLDSHALLSRAGEVAGRAVPYVRMFVFERLSDDHVGFH